MMLVAGLLASGTGATLAVSGPSDRGASASQAYPDQQVAGQDQGGNAGGNNLAGEQQGADKGTASQPAAQTAATGSGNGLPFTGLAAIPVLLMGLALLSLGLLLGRKTRNERS